jgi:Asp-tRNA(Asn)/Glu-tRNA(Gln) amidotransferase A subunit family amidase
MPHVVHVEHSALGQRLQSVHQHRASPPAFPRICLPRRRTRTRAAPQRPKPSSPSFVWQITCMQCIQIRIAVQVFEEMGAKVEQTDPGFQDPLEIFDVQWFAGRQCVARLRRAAPRDDGSGPYRNRQRGRRILRVAVSGGGRRSELAIHVGRFHADYDLLLTPAVPIPAFEAGREVPAGSPLFTEVPRSGVLGSSIPRIRDAL